MNSIFCFGFVVVFEVSAWIQSFCFAFCSDWANLIRACVSRWIGSIMMFNFDVILHCFSPSWTFWFPFIACTRLQNEKDCFGLLCTMYLYIHCTCYMQEKSCKYACAELYDRPPVHSPPIKLFIFARYILFVHCASFKEAFLLHLRLSIKFFKIVTAQMRCICLAQMSIVTSNEYNSALLVSSKSITEWLQLFQERRRERNIAVIAFRIHFQI